MRALVLMMILGLVVMACSQGTPQTNDGTAAAGTSPDNANAAAGDAKTAANDGVKNTPTDENKLAEKTGSGSSASADFLKLISGKANLEWKIAYDLSTTYGGKTSAGTMTQYFKTEKKMRIDSTFDAVEAQMYVVNDLYTTCSKAEGKWTCFKIDTVADNNQSTEQFEKSVEDNPADYTVVSDGTKQVAGVTADCFKVVDKKTSSTARYCFKDSLPLYVYMQSADGKTEMTATSYSKSVSDSVFTPPAVAQDMGALTGGLGGGAGGAAFDACAACSYLSGADKTDCLASCK